MANISVGTTVVPIPYDGDAILVLQNLGTGNVYFDHDPNVTTSTGFKLATGNVYEFPRQLNKGGPGDAVVYVIADAAAQDVRYVEL